jgi:hypothetical protein
VAVCGRPAGGAGDVAVGVRPRERPLRAVPCRANAGQLTATTTRTRTGNRTATRFRSTSKAQIAAFRDRDLDRFLSFYLKVTIRDFDGNVVMDGGAWRA